MTIVKISFMYLWLGVDGLKSITGARERLKGRIEHLWETLQSRLPVEFKIAEINTLKEANRFLQEGYLDEFNGLFAVNAADERIAYRSAESIDLSRILCVKEKRKVDGGGVFAFTATTSWSLPRITNHRFRPEHKYQFVSVI